MDTGPVDDVSPCGRRVPPSDDDPSATPDDEGSRRELLDALQRIAVNLETAEVLELRAERATSPALADVLRERAAERRRTAGRLRADLVARGVLAPQRPRSPD